MLPRPVDLSTVAALRWVAAHRLKLLLFPPFALVAQQDRALEYGSGGWGFESSRARHLFPCSAGGALDLRSPAAALPWPIEGPIDKPFGRGALDRRPREGARALSAPRLLRRRPKVLSARSSIARAARTSSLNRCRGCPRKKACTRGRARKLSVSWHEDARQTARELAGTEAYKRSRRQRYKVERLFGELKTRINLRRLRLRRLRNASERFLMAATAQNLKRLVKHLDRLEVKPA